MDNQDLIARLKEMELADGDCLSIRRVISKSGRNRAFINGRTVNLALNS